MEQEIQIAVENKSKPKRVPKLRFKEFDGNWNETTLGHLFTFKNGLNSDKEKYGSGIKFINVLDIIANEVITNDSIIGKVEVTDKELEKNKVIYGDVLFQRSSETREEVGQSNIYVDKTEAAVFGGFVIRGRKKQNYDPYFINYLLKTSPARKEITTKSGGSTRYNVGQESLSQVKVKLTKLPEQQKIATFLSAVDKKIQQLTRKKELLKTYKKGVMQQLFSQQLRFKNENGKDFPEWENVRMEEVFERVKRKNLENNLNVLTISAQQGLINQEIYFNKSVSAKDVSTYYLVRKGEFAYNKSYSKGYPMGAIKRLDRYEIGVVSTLYICFKLKPNNDSDFYQEFLDYGGINRELHKIAQEGARNHGLLNLSVIEFFRDIEIPQPSEKEQIVIGQFLLSLSNKIRIFDKELILVKSFKKGLLQQMFV